MQVYAQIKASLHIFKKPHPNVFCLHQASNCVLLIFTWPTVIDVPWPVNKHKIKKKRLFQKTHLTKIHSKKNNYCNVSLIGQLGLSNVFTWSREFAWSVLLPHELRKVPRAYTAAALTSATGSERRLKSRSGALSRAPLHLASSWPSQIRPRQIANHWRSTGSLSSSSFRQRVIRFPASAFKPTNPLDLNI